MDVALIGYGAIGMMLAQAIDRGEAGKTILVGLHDFESRDPKFWVKVSVKAPNSEKFRRDLFR